MDYATVAQQMRDRLTVLDEERAQLLRGIEAVDALAKIGPPVRSASDRKNERAARPSLAMQPTRNAVQAILEEAGRPIETRALVPLVKQRGIEIGGKDEIATLSARLSSSPMFTVRRGIGWWFEGRPIPGDRQNTSSSEEAEGGTLLRAPSAPSQIEEGGEWHHASPD